MMNAILFFALGWPDGIPSLDEIRAMDEKLRLRERFGIMELDTLPPDLPWDILKYSINLTIDTVGDSIMNARCDVEFQITEDSVFLRLNFVDSMSATPNLGLVVDSVLLDGAPAIWSLSGSDTGRILNIVIPNPSPGRIDTASVFYHGPPTHPEGIISSGGLTIGDTICYVDDEPWGARHWFPCVDVPSEKARSEITATVPAGWRVVANGVLVDSVQNFTWWTYRWVNDRQIATYLIVFAAYDYATIRDTFIWAGDTLPIVHYVSHADSAAAELDYKLLPRAMEGYSALYGVYPFMDQKYSQVQIDELGGAMENQTNTFTGFGIYGDSLRTIWVQAHELSHHWWGDYVTCGTWPDIWLNEGFATFSEAVWWGWYWGPNMYQYWIDSVRMRIYLQYYTWPPIPIYNPGQSLEELFSVETYDKAGCVLHSLKKITEYLLGGDTLAFWAALRYYKNNHAESYALTRDFTQEYQAFTGLSLGWFFDEWLYRPGHPKYDVGWEADSIGGGMWQVGVLIKQTQSHDYGVPTFKMPVPMRFRDGTLDTTVILWDSLDVQGFSITLPGKPTTLQFDPENWIIDEHIVHIGIDEGASDRIATRIISVGPTPTRNIFRIEFVSCGGIPADLKAYSVDGRLVCRESAITKPGLNSVSVDLSRAPAGLYIVELKLGGRGLLSTKVVRK
ncbi:MAG: M1 family aminopeptidase [candidate division WOR-3 bacterium]